MSRGMSLVKITPYELLKCIQGSHIHHYTGYMRTGDFASFWPTNKCRSQEGHRRRSSRAILALDKMLDSRPEQGWSREGGAKTGFIMATNEDDDADAGSRMFLAPKMVREQGKWEWTKLLHGLNSGELLSHLTSSKGMSTPTQVANSFITGAHKNCLLCLPN